jgi:hypothetical protein
MSLLVGLEFCQVSIINIATSYLYGNHILFIVSLVTCCYSLYKASSIDPGFVKQSATIDEKNDIVNGLAEIGRLTPRDYCVTCRVFLIH